MVPFESTIPTTAIDPIKLPSEKKGLHSDFEQAIFNEDAGLREAAVPPCLKKNHCDTASGFKSPGVSCLFEWQRQGFRQESMSSRDTSFELYRFIIFKEPTVCMVQEVAAKKHIHRFLLSLDQKEMEFTKIFVSVW